MMSWLRRLAMASLTISRLLADRAAALGNFLGSENGAGLMPGWRRAASILKSEESKDKTGICSQN